MSLELTRRCRLESGLGSTRLKSILIDNIRVKDDQVVFMVEVMGTVWACVSGELIHWPRREKAGEIVRHFFKG